MPIDDPAMLEALAKYNNENRQTRHRADIAATIVLLIVHGVLACGTALALLGAVSNEACAYLQCGGQSWLTQAFGVGVLASGMSIRPDLAVAVLQIVRRKLAVVVPAIGCIAQVALGFATYTIISEAALG